jgi:outer membrane protein TolC
MKKVLPVVVSLLFLANLECHLFAQEVRKISLREAVQLAISKSPDAEVERVAIRDAQAGLFGARGSFDPVLRLDGNGRRATTPTSSPFESPTGSVSQLDWNQGISLTQQLPWNGLSYRAAFNNTRISTTNPFFALNPFFSPRASFEISLPLLRNRSLDPARANLLVSKKLVNGADQQFVAQLNQLGARVESAYWQWVAATALTATALELRDLADQARASTERLVKEGELADAELNGAMAQFQRRQEVLANATGQRAQAEQALKALIAADANDIIWTERWQPADKGLTREVVPVDDLVSKSLRDRAELKVFAAQLEVRDVERQLASQATKPQVNVTAGYSTQGLSGRELNLGEIFPGFSAQVPRSFIGGLGTSIGQIAGLDFSTYQAGLAIELPFRNRTAQGQLQRADLARRKAELDLKRLQIAIGLEVRTAFEAAQAAEARLQAAESAAEASDARLASELRLFREGQSNNLNINVRQNELAESRQLAVDARRSLNTAVGELRRATASVLNDFGIEIKP